MKISLKKSCTLLAVALIAMLLFSSCVAMKGFFSGFSDGGQDYYSGDYYDDGYEYGDDGARDDFLD